MKNVEVALFGRIKTVSAPLTKSVSHVIVELSCSTTETVIGGRGK